MASKGACKSKGFISFLGSSILFLLLSVCTVYGSEPFKDVGADHWAYHQIQQLRVLGVTDGIGENLFGLGKQITRAEFTTFLVKLLQLPQQTLDAGFQDVSDDKWYHAPIKTALANGIIVKNEDNFRPDDWITREEMAVMIVRALGYDQLAGELKALPSPFSDVEKNASYITIAKDFGIVNGVNGKQFCPAVSAKREEAAVMMVRMKNRLDLTGEKPKLHGFYAISSYGQRDFISSLDGVSFGWSRLEYKEGQLQLNTTGENRNEYGIPKGAGEPMRLAEGKRRMLMVALHTGHQVDGIPLHRFVVQNQENRTQVVNLLVKQLEQPVDGMYFDGITLDIEDLRKEQRENFTLLVEELSLQLHKRHKYLYVAVQPARRPGLAYYDGYDFGAIGKVVDGVILMAHDYQPKALTPQEMELGLTAIPIAPIQEVYVALQAICNQMDAKKVMLQISFDGAQLKMREGQIVDAKVYHPPYSAIAKRLEEASTQKKYVSKWESPYIQFRNQTDHTDNILWYENQRSVEAKIKLAAMFGVNQISLWRLGIVPNDGEGLNVAGYFAR